MKTIKIVLIGDGAVGKTCLRIRYMGESFTSNYMWTIGADFAIKVTKLTDGTDIQFQIWDLAGQNGYATVRENFYKGSIGAICLFDLSRPDTFNSLDGWINEFWEFNGQGIMPVIIIGNKKDLRDKPEDNDSHLGKCLSFEEGEKLASKYSKELETQGFKIKYLETSAKTGENVEEAFLLLGKTIMGHFFKE